MFKCYVCKDKAFGKCTITNNLYCNSMCQYIGFKLINGNDDEDLEVFTQEPISSIPKKDVIQIYGKTYSLPHLYNWVVNLGKKTDPLTKQKIDEVYVKKVGHDLYPLKCKILQLKPFEQGYIMNNVSTLMSVNYWFKQALSGLININIDTDYEFLLNYVRYDNIEFFIRKKTCIEYLLEYENQQIINVFKEEESINIVLFYTEKKPDMLVKLLDCKKYAEKRGFPTGEIEQKINSIKFLV